MALEACVDPYAPHLSAPSSSAEPYIKTRSGAIVPFGNPKPEHIHFMDIAWAICNMPRFTGHAPIVVGQHTMEVGRLMMDRFERGDPERLEAGLVGVVHDFREAYVGDVSSPLKAVIKGHFREIDNRFGDVIHERFGLTKAAEKHHGLMRDCDFQCLYEDAVRFRMDGIIHDPTYGADIQVERGWVPKDFKSSLPNEVLEPVRAELALWKMFTSLMVKSGRGHLL